MAYLFPPKPLAPDSANRSKSSSPILSKDRVRTKTQKLQVRKLGELSRSGREPPEQIKLNQYRMEGKKKEIGYMQSYIRHIDTETSSKPLLILISLKDTDNIDAVVLNF